MTTKITNSLKRKESGERGKGKYYHVELRPRAGFIAFATQDVGKKGRLLRVAGKRASGVWYTVAWLIEKNLAHIARNGRLIVDDVKARTVLHQIVKPIIHKKGDIFSTTPRYTVPEAKRWLAIRQLKPRGYI